MNTETIDFIAAILGWSMVFNYGLLLVWMMFLMSARLWTYQLHNRWFNISDQEFGVAHYRGMMQFKLAILLFNMAPYLAIRIVA